MNDRPLPRATRHEVQPFSHHEAGAGGASGTPTDPTDARIRVEATLVGRLAALASGRVLVIDYLRTRPSWDLPAAELSARLQATAPAAAQLVATVEGVPCVADPRLHGVLREAGVELRGVAGGVLGQFAVHLDRPLVWLDFLSSVAARRD